MTEELWQEEVPEVEKTGIFDKEAVKKDVGRIGWGLIIYTLISYVIVLVDTVWQMILIRRDIADVALQEQQFAALAESAVSMIIGISIGVVFLWLLMGKRVDLKVMFEEKKQMTFKTFFVLLSVFMAAQLAISFLAQLLELRLNAMGYTAMESIEAATSSSQTISMFIYGSFVAPIAEELIYRGFVLEPLRKYGKMFAIVVSAILFGIMHANLTQSVFAFCVGLVLGYVAIEYSIKWAILIHMINNCVFGEMIAIAGKVFGETVETVLNTVVIVGFFIVGILILWKDREKIRAYVDENKTDEKIYIYGLTTVSMILFIGANLLMAILAIQPLG